jgi:hypothetical protein
MTWVIKDWDKNYETADSRRRSRLDWVAIPNKHDGKGFRRLFRLPDAGEIFGGWVLILQVASKCPVRGVLADADGPLTAEDIADKVGCSISMIEKALDAVSHPSIGWIQTLADSAPVHTEPHEAVQAHTISHESTRNGVGPHEILPTVQDKTEQNKNKTEPSNGRSVVERAKPPARPPAGLISISDWPLTAAAVRRGRASPSDPPQYPLADDAFVARVVGACLARLPTGTTLDDQTLADAVATAAAASPRQEKHGLFLTSVPEVIKTWAQQ